MGGVSEADELAAFYAARLDEDEAAAAAVLGAAETFRGAPQRSTPLGHQVFDGSGIVVTHDRTVVLPSDVATHIARHDPARVLCDVEAGRRLLREYKGLLERKARHESHCRAAPHYTPFTRPGYPSNYDLLRERHFLEQALPQMRELVKARVAVWSDHPEYGSVRAAVAAASSVEAWTTPLPAWT